jgi:hypothetical protein
LLLAGWDIAKQDGWSKWISSGQRLDKMKDVRGGTKKERGKASARSKMNADEGSTILEEFARLSKQKDAIEAEIAAIADELTSGPNAAGLRGPLVDAEGFPRADIDVYRVRHQRHTFACKQTDHRMIMESIEKLLPLYVNRLQEMGFIFLLLSS